MKKKKNMKKKDKLDYDNYLRLGILLPLIRLQWNKSPVSLGAKGGKLLANAELGRSSVLSKLL